MEVIVFGNRENLENKYANPDEIKSNMNISDAGEHRNLKGPHVGETSEASIPIVRAVLYGTTFYIHSFDGILMAEFEDPGNGIVVCVKDYLYWGSANYPSTQVAITMIPTTHVNHWNHLVIQSSPGEDQICLSLVGSKYYYYTSDQINSTRIITDSSGSVVYSAVFDPYGGMQKQWVNTYSPSLKFSGKERESGSEMDYFGARYYGHMQYRFISVDPVINKDEALTNPQLWNLYSYCKNNPITYLDPEGRDAISTATKIYQQALVKAFQNDVNRIANALFSRQMNAAEGQMVADQASTWKDTPYAQQRPVVKGPQGGGDCSGITEAAFKEAGFPITMNKKYTSSGVLQIINSQNMTPVQGAPQPGDVASWSSPANHAAIYSGNNKVWSTRTPPNTYGKYPTSYYGNNQAPSYFRYTFVINLFK